VRIISVASGWDRNCAANIARERIVSASAASYIISSKKAPRYIGRSAASCQSATVISIWARLTEGTLTFYKDTVSTIAR